MKNIFVTSLVALSASVSLRAQGLVNFANTTTTPVYVQHTYPDTSSSIISSGDSLAPYYFGLFLGQPGSLYFTGLYATNTGINGLFSGGVVAVPGWAPGTSTNYIVFGWSGQHDLSPQWFGGIHPFIFGHDGPANGALVVDEADRQCVGAEALGGVVVRAGYHP